MKRYNWKKSKKQTIQDTYGRADNTVIRHVFSNNYIFHWYVQRIKCQGVFW